MRALWERLTAYCQGNGSRIETLPVWDGVGLGIVVFGSALYGATVGWWQAPMQAVYAAIKFPVLILATVFGNAIGNGMLAQVLGMPLGFRESLRAVLTSFVMATLLLATFTPVSVLLAWSAPTTDRAYSVVLLTHMTAIAYAGVAGNVRLFRWLQQRSGNRTMAQRVLLAWLAGNLLVGTQVSWILSPFIGDPRAPVVFIQQHPLRRNFFEYAFERVAHLVRPENKTGKKT